MGDRFRTDKPPRHKTMHLGRLSLSHPSVGRQKGVLAVAPATAREERRVLRNSRFCNQDCWHNGLVVKGADC